MQKLSRTAPRLVVAADKATPELVKQLQELSKSKEDLAVVLATEQVGCNLLASVTSRGWQFCDAPFHAQGCIAAHQATPHRLASTPTQPIWNSNPAQRQLDNYGLSLDCTCKQELLIDDPKVGA